MQDHPDTASSNNNNNNQTLPQDTCCQPPGAAHKQARLRHLAASLFIIGLFVLLTATLYFGIKVFLVIFAGILFAVLLRSIANWLATKLPLPGKWCVLVAALGLAVIIGGAGWLLVPNLSQQVDELTTSLPRSVDQLQQSLSQYGWGRAMLAKAPDADQVLNNSGGVAATVTNAFQITLNVIGNFVAIIFLGLFFAFSPSTYTNGLIALLPRRREARAREVLDALGTTLSRWLFGQLATMAIVAVLTTIGLWALGVELALVLGLLAGLLAFIPNIGPVIGAIPAIMIGLLDSPQQALWIIALYIVVQTVESYVFYPLIQKKMVSLPPALILAAQFLMAVTLGTLALAMATPLAAAALVMVKMLYVEDVLGKSIHLPGDQVEVEN